MTCQICMPQSHWSKLDILWVIIHIAYCQDVNCIILVKVGNPQRVVRDDVSNLRDPISLATSLPPETAPLSQTADKQTTYAVLLQIV